MEFRRYHTRKRPVAEYQVESNRTVCANLYAARLPRIPQFRLRGDGEGVLVSSSITLRVIRVLQALPRSPSGEPSPLGPEKYSPGQFLGRTPACNFGPNFPFPRGRFSCPLRHRTQRYRRNYSLFSRRSCHGHKRYREVFALIYFSDRCCASAVFTGGSIHSS